MSPILGLFAALCFLAGALYCLKYLNQGRSENGKQEQLIEQALIKKQVDIPRNLKKARQPLNFFLVLDVEATCVPGTDFAWPNEIIVSNYFTFYGCFLQFFNVGVACYIINMGRSRHRGPCK